MYLINNCYQFLGLNNNVPTVNEKTTIEAPPSPRKFISLKKKRPKLNRPCPKSKKRFQIDQFSPVVVPGKNYSFTNKGILGASTIILTKDIDKYVFMCSSNFY